MFSTFTDFLDMAPASSMPPMPENFILMSFPTSVTHRISLNFFHRSLKKKEGGVEYYYSPYQNVPSKRSFGSVETQVCLLTVKEFLKNSQEEEVGP